MVLLIPLIILWILQSILVKRLELVNFLSVIQLVTALNIANVSSKLHSKMFESLIDVDSFFNMRFGSLQERMTVDLESLRSMSPLMTTDGKTNKNKIETLKQEYSNLSAKWTNEKERSRSLMSEFQNRKGINSMFLFLSLYCIFDMFLIAYNSDFYSPKNEFWFGCYTFLTAFILWIYFVVILHKKADHISNGYLYIGSAFIPVVCLILSHFSYAVNSVLLEHIHIIIDENSFLCCSDSLAVILPYLGFILCFIFIAYNWAVILWKTNSSIQNLEKEQERMHNAKIAIDNVYDSFEPSDIEFK